MILAIDIGTTNLKVALVKQGKLYNFKSLQHRQGQPWVSLSAVTELLSHPVPCSLFPVPLLPSAIAISSQGPSLIALDKYGEVASFIPYTDGSWVKEGQPSVFLSKIAFFKEHNPHLFQTVKYFVTLADYFVYLLTGNLQTSLPSHNSQYQPFIWDDKQIEAYGFDKNLFPTFTPAGKVLGYHQNIPVVLTTFDFMAGLLGCGKAEEKVAINRTGTSEGFNFFSLIADNPPIDPPFGQWRVSPHPSGQGFNKGVVDDNASAFYHGLMKQAGYNDMEKFLDDGVVLPHLAPTLQLIKEHLAKVKPFLQAFNIEKIKVTGGFGYSKALNALKQEVWQIKVESFENPYTELLGLETLTRRYIN